MPTLIAKIRRVVPSVPSDGEEWIISIAVLAVGILWLVFPATFLRPDMDEFLDIMSARLWTTSAIMIGLVSCVAIVANSQAPRVAGLLRIGANLARLTLFGAFIGRSIAASQFDLFSASVGIVWYSAFFALDMRNVMQSFAETFNAFRKVYRVRPTTLVR